MGASQASSFFIHDIPGSIGKPFSADERWSKSYVAFFQPIHGFQVTDFVERLMKHASNGEVLLFKQPLDKRLHQLLSYTPELNLASLTELEFISNFQAIQVHFTFRSWKIPLF